MRKFLLLLLVFSSILSPAKGVYNLHEKKTENVELVKNTELLKSPETLGKMEKQDITLTLDSLTPSREILAKAVRTAASETSADKLWDMGLEGQGVTVAVIDSGIDFSHPTFANTSHQAYSFVNESYGYPVTEDTTDYLGHGTAVASLIAGDGSPDGIYRGMASKVSLVSLKVASKGELITITGLLKAIEKAKELKVDIINLSLSETEGGEEIDILEAAVQSAVHEGITVVASAGNEGTGGSSMADPFSVKSPGSAPDAISVGNIKFDFQLAISSSEGPNQLMISKPDILAFGTDIQVASTSGSFTPGSGTSFSTPLVTGLLALIASDHNPGELKSALLRSARNTSLRIEQGSLFPNISRAYEFLQSQEPYLSPIVKQYTNYYHIAVTSSYRDLKWSANVPVKFLVGEYTDVLEVYVADTTVVELTSSIGEKLEFKIERDHRASKVLIDIRTTEIDSFGGLDRVIGKDMIPLVEYLESRNMEVVEYNRPLTYSLLKAFDLVILPDFATLTYDYSGLGNSTTSLTAEEIQALYYYYNTGGSILVDFGGRTRFDTNYDHKALNTTLLEEFMKKFALEVSGVLSSSWVNGEIVNTTEMGQTVTKGYAGRQTITGGIPLISSDQGPSSIALVSRGRMIVDSIREWRSNINTGAFGNDFIYGRQRIDWLLDRNITIELVPSYAEMTYKISTNNFESSATDDHQKQTVTINSKSDIVYIDVQDEDKYIRGNFSTPNILPDLTIEIGRITLNNTEVPPEFLYLYADGKLVDSFPDYPGTHYIEAFLQYSQDIIYYGELYYTISSDGKTSISNARNSTVESTYFSLISFIPLMLLSLRKRKMLTL